MVESSRRKFPTKRRSLHPSTQPQPKNSSIEGWVPEEEKRA